MQKSTVLAMLEKLEREARKVKDEKEREARLSALTKCRRWLTDSTWSQLLTPLGNERAVLSKEGLPLLEKRKREPLSEGELARLNELVAADSIYEQFKRKVTPTVRRAQRDQQKRQREQAARGRTSRLTER